VFHRQSRARLPMVPALVFSAFLHGTLLAAWSAAARPPAPGQPATALQVSLRVATPDVPARGIAGKAIPVSSPPHAAPAVPPPPSTPLSRQRPPVAAAPRAAATAGTSGGAHRLDPDLRALIRNRLRRELSARFRYPRVARRRGWEGRVVLGLRLAPDGRLHRPRVVHSSGHGVLDRAALEAVAGTGTLDWAPPLLQGVALDLDLPVIYRLTGD